MDIVEIAALGVIGLMCAAGAMALARQWLRDRHEQRYPTRDYYDEVAEAAAVEVGYLSHRDFERRAAAHHHH